MHFLLFYLHQLAVSRHQSCHKIELAADILDFVLRVLRSTKSFTCWATDGQVLQANRWRLKLRLLQAEPMKALTSINTLLEVKVALVDAGVEVIEPIWLLLTLVGSKAIFLTKMLHSPYGRVKRPFCRLLILAEIVFLKVFLAWVGLESCVPLMN